MLLDGGLWLTAGCENGALSFDSCSLGLGQWIMTGNFHSNPYPTCFFRVLHGATPTPTMAV